ncbi:Amiloride-sensitive sodium channel [Globodera pallida]|nr:Amiloride-sensitive sodium channel [Globodera pallida]
MKDSSFCQCHRRKISRRSLSSQESRRVQKTAIGNKNEFRAGLEITFSDFAENTSAHGIPRAYTSRGRLRRFLWLLLFMCCFVAFIGQAVQIVKRFWRNDIIVGVELKFETIPFPSNSLAREMTAVGDTLSAYDHAMDLASYASHSHHRSRQRRANENVGTFLSPTRQRFYTKYEGLLAVFSFCDCSASKLGCRALNDENAQDGQNRTRPLCLCFYNQQNEQVWPCFEPAQWLERRCGGCTALGNCDFVQDPPTMNGTTDNDNDTNDGTTAAALWPCLCAPPIRICVRVDDNLPQNESVGTVNNTTSSSTGGEPPLLERVPKIWELKKAELPRMETPEQKESREEAYGLRGVYDPIAIRAKAVENLVFAVSQLSEAEQSQMGYSKREFITKCSFNGRECSVDEDFSLYVDPTYGNCFTFNARPDKNVLSERAGPNYGLRFQVFVNVSDYLPTTEAAGVRITVHNPEEQPFPDTHGHRNFVKISFGIRLKCVNRLPSPYGDCVQHGKTEEYIYRDKEYSTEGCQRSCIQRMLVSKCGCGDPRFPRYLNFRNCPVGDPGLRACLQREMHSAARSATQQPDCICRQPCREQVFSITYSCARWPSSDWALYGECDPSLSGAQCLQFHREQSAIVEVYFEQLNYESLQESEAYGLPNLLSDFGGQLGLWMGVSVITIMEVGILISELFILFFVRKLINWLNGLLQIVVGTDRGVGPLLPSGDMDPMAKKRRVLVHNGSVIRWA